MSGRRGAIDELPAAAAAAAGDAGYVAGDGVRPKSSQTTSCQCDRLGDLPGKDERVDRGSASVVT